MKFITFGKDVIGGLEEQALKPILSKVKNEGMNEIVILAHSSTENIGGHDVKSFVKYIENIKEFNKGDSEEVKHIYLLGCEVGFVNEKGESLAQEIADEFARSGFLKTGYKNVVVHAISNNKTEYVGMRVEVVSQAGKLHSQIEKMQDGHVRAFGYKTKEALDCEDRLSFLNTEIPKIFKELKQMPEYIDNNGTKNIQKTKKREELEELRKEETKLLKQREELVQNKVIETIVATNNPYQDICRNKDYEFRPKGQKLSLQLVQNDNQSSKKVEKVQDVPNEVEAILKALDNDVPVNKKGLTICKEKLSSAGENWKLVLQEITHALKYHEKRTGSSLYKCLKKQCGIYSIDYDVGIYNKAKNDIKTPKIEKRIDDNSSSSRSSEGSYDIEEIEQVDENKGEKKKGVFEKLKNFVGVGNWTLDKSHAR